ncbi:MAG: type II toxin-antitoxin system HicB family antitoxin [Erysipelotrichaceae bacterium]|nr:type II toxin-antitoxin system HicB family antitoxin [Erysipelotrichaceae bacterium]
MNVVYPACFLKEEKGYSVIFPDMDYLATQGDDLHEAIGYATEALAGYIYFERKEGREIPVASDLSTVDIEKVAKEIGIDATEGSFVNLISVDVEEYARHHFEKTIRKTLTIPYWLNKMAEDRNINFSKVLKEALIKELL